MSSFYLAQLNIARMRAPLESPLMSDFVANLERINALAESSPGYVWRLKTDEGDATSLRPIGADTLVNMSIWESIASLRDFVFRSGHVDIMRRRKEWFEQMSDAYMVLWWIPKGHIPSVEEALGKLAQLQQHGPCPEAFSFRSAFPPPDELSLAKGPASQDECPAT